MATRREQGVFLQRARNILSVSKPTPDGRLGTYLALIVLGCEYSDEPNPLIRKLGARRFATEFMMSKLDGVK
jgi:hypothetical protein